MSCADPQQTVTRFAPSPTGRLHLGHAYSALHASESARDAGGRFPLRIEDIDARAAGEFEAGILEDLAWLGLEWETPVWRQSDHMADYAAALDRLQTLDVVYPCFCTRRDIQREIERGGAPHGREGRYIRGPAGICLGERQARIAAGEAHAFRLNAAAAAEMTGPLVFADRARGQVDVDSNVLGEVALARKDIGTSYHIAVTVDDARQGITCVTRGEDLLEATHVHRQLQALLGLPAPDYAHHRLLVDADGKRFAKRDKAVTIQSLREDGQSADAVRAAAGF